MSKAVLWFLIVICGGALTYLGLEHGEFLDQWLAGIPQTQDETPVQDQQ